MSNYKSSVISKKEGTDLESFGSQLPIQTASDPVPGKKINYPNVPNRMMSINTTTIAFEIIICPLKKEVSDNGGGRGKPSRSHKVPSSTKSTPCIS